MSIFTEVQLPNVATSRFDLSHDVKMSFNMGKLIPSCVMECIPGDQFSINVQNLLRFAPLVSPVMHRVHVTTHFFFVPNRILWPNWERWITGDLEVEHPFVNFSGQIGDVNLGEGSLGDYLGYPLGTVGLVPADAMKASPFAAAAYYKIFDEYYRDQNLVAEKYVELVDGDNTALYGAIMNSDPLSRAWMHDYFTSALPFAQKGDAVQVPLVTQNDIPVDYNNNTGTKPIFRNLNTNAIEAATGFGQVTGQGGSIQNLSNSANVGYDPNGTLSVDVQAGATDINTLRRAFRLQEWLERNARGGTRYIESMLAHFGVKSSDKRLQRPEYLGGAKQNMIISEVLNTAGSTGEADSPKLEAVGTMAGHGISAGGGGNIRYYAEEHGFIIGLINVQPVTAYTQGLHRQFSRFDRLDYAWPTFANIGEQEIRVKELFTLGLTVAQQEEIFGYVPRYAEYKYINSRVAGDFRFNLSFWHLARQFANKPVLNEEFITADPRTDIFAVTDTDEDHIYAHIFNRVSAVRKLPKFGIPTI
ncbi:major capsid protein [Microviridae sp.]|nr:major capsid protein [Microviridae sp.]